MEKEQSVWESKNVWEQIEEDQQDYQYFKEHDDEKLHQTLEAIKLDIDKNQEV